MDFIKQAAEIAKQNTYEEIVIALQMATIDYLLDRSVPHQLTLYTLCAAHQYKFATMNGTPLDEVINTVEQAAKAIQK